VSDSATFGRTVTDELCVKDDSGTSCYTRSQLDGLISGSVLGATTHAQSNEAADASSARASFKIRELLRIQIRAL
jgi:hypothetical protein